MPFAALALGACLLMSRIARDPGAGRGAVRTLDTRVVLLGLLIGLAALARNEAVWIGLAWAIVAWGIPGLDLGVAAQARGRGRGGGRAGLPALGHP